MSCYIKVCCRYDVLASSEPGLLPFPSQEMRTNEARLEAYSTVNWLQSCGRVAAALSEPQPLTGDMWVVTSALWYGRENRMSTPSKGPAQSVCCQAAGFCIWVKEMARGVPPSWRETSWGLPGGGAGELGLMVGWGMGFGGSSRIMTSSLSASMSPC